MGFDFTNSQKDALKVLDHDTLVSAGAGSGKTRVLTERIACIIESGVSPLNILVLTFTKNAAGEMKTRVKKRLKNSSPKTLNLLEQADISTIDSFVMNTVKKYFYKINIRPDVNIIDSNVLSMQKSLILDQIFEELYEERDPIFLDYIRNYTEKNDDYVKSYFLDLIKKVELDIDLDNFLNNAYSTYTSIEFRDNAKRYIIKILKKYLSSFLVYLEEFVNISDSPTSRDSAIEQVNLLSNVLKSDDYSQFSNFITQFKIKAKKRDEEENEYAKKLKDSLRKTTYFSKPKDIVSLAPTIDELIDTYLVKDEYINLYIKVLRKFFTRLDEFKDLNNAYDFSDLAKKLYKLLLTDSDVRLELSNKYQYILLDEYQDTSDIQEGILKLISHNNMYMVGDIKQSIYRFRNANPDIFKYKYNNFSKINEAKEDCLGVRIDMIENFRSRSEVLDDINTIFRPIMTLDYGDCDYTKGHEMVFGNKSYDEHKFLNDHNMDIFTFTVPEEDADGKKIKYPFTDIEIECFKVARDIKTKMSAKYMVLRDGKEEVAKYSDFCIIVDKEKNYDTYKKIFEYMSIPLSVIQDVKMTTSDTTMVLTNVIKLISLANSSFKNPDYTHAFMSIARSFLYSWDDSYIFNLITNNNIDNEISNIARELNSSIDIESNSSIYLKALNKFNFFKTISKTNNITNKEHEAEYIYNTIVSLDSINYSLSEICTYFEECQDKELDIKYKLDHNEEDAVKLMNIHKSKGLEFAVCYFIGLSSKPNVSDENIPIFDKEFGFTTLKNVTLDDEFKDLNSIFIGEKTKEARKSERLRLFYVALTRAKEKMIFVTRDFRENNLLVKDDILTFRDYLAYAYNSKTANFDKYIKPFELDELGLSSNYHQIKEIGNLSNFNVVPNYELNKTKEEIKKDRISKNITNVLSSEELNSIDLGLRLHEIFESLDFSNLSLDEYNLNDFEKNIISKVLANPLFENIKEAKTFKEHEFKFVYENSLYNGIIDLLVVYNDHIDIIDYKLSDINKSEYERQLKLYKEYVKSKSDLRINCYLLSILKNEIKEVLV